MSTSYKTVRDFGCDELTEKRSRFIGYCKPVTTEQDAIDFINKIKKEHWDARHNVYAYCLREGQIKRYSDDGEPQGTAGMPVLDVMLKNEVTDAVVVVTRYFGGILLGTGGLVRAYSAGCKIALDSAKIVTMQLCSDCSVTCSYTQYGKLNTLIIAGGGYVDDTDFADDVTLRFHIPTELIPALNKEFADATAGKISVEIIEEKYYQIL
ncbi:MAG: YigZ family protein [Ruminococcus sp.]|nr:YigZ family protein [Ruminococcus sp.]